MPYVRSLIIGYSALLITIYHWVIDSYNIINRTNVDYNCQHPDTKEPVVFSKKRHCSLFVVHLVLLMCMTVFVFGAHLHKMFIYYIFFTCMPCYTVFMMYIYVKYIIGSLDRIELCCNISSLLLFATYLILIQVYGVINILEILDFNKGF